MSDTNPTESMDAEGLPPLEDRPPGITAETDSDGLMVPRDHPVATGVDPAYATTEAEDRNRELVADRAEREQPDFGHDELGVGGSVQGAAWDRAQHFEQGGYVVGAISGNAGPDALAEAIDVDEPLGGDLADDDLAATRSGAGLPGDESLQAEASAEDVAFMESGQRPE